MNIVAFGDSITEAVIGIRPEENWLVLLGKKLGPGYQLFNAGVGGNSAREAMARYDRDVLARKPDLILLEFGGNNHDPNNLGRRVSDAELIAYLAEFKKDLPQGCRVVMITFPPIIDEIHSCGKHPLFEHGLDQAMESQREIVRDFAAENGYPLLDLYKIIYPHRGEMILPDGVHLNAAGNRQFAESVFDLLEKAGYLC